MVQVDLVPTHVVAVSALADVWERMGLVQPYCEMLMLFWCESAALSNEVNLRLRALVCRTLGRQPSLAADTLTFIRQHVVRLPSTSACAQTQGRSAISQCEEWPRPCSHD